MSGFEKIFITNEILRTLAGSFSLNEAFKKMFAILESHVGIAGAAVLSYNDRKMDFDVPGGLFYKIEQDEVTLLVEKNRQKLYFKDFNPLDPASLKFAPPEGKNCRYYCFPLFSRTHLAGALVLKENDADTPVEKIDASFFEAIAAPISIIYEREKLFKETKDQKNGFEFLYKLSNSVNKTLDVESILKVSIRAICEKFSDIIPVFVITRGSIELIAAGTSQNVGLKENFGSIADEIRGGLNINTQNFKTIISELAPDGENKNEKAGVINFKSALWLSLNFNDNICGYLGLFSISDSLQKINVTSIRFLTLASNQIISAIENARLYNEVERLASIDGMTGVFNYRYFYSHLCTEIERARRYATDLSIIMIDIDHFKSFNDIYGHQAGDEVLRETGKILMIRARQTDIVARYGGEEFILVLPETSQEGALELAERIREAIELKDFPVHSKDTELSLKVTVSVGVSSYYAEDKPQADVFIKAADDSLYHAKHSGRNRVCYHENGQLKQFRRTI